MEFHHFSTVIPTRTATTTFSLAKFPQSRHGFSFLNSVPRNRNSVAVRRLRDPSPDQKNQSKEEENAMGGVGKKTNKGKLFRWRSAFLGETETSKKKENKAKDMTDYIEDPGSMEWCVRARKLALRSIEERGFGHKLERMVTPKKKKKKNRKSTNKGKIGKLSLSSLDRVLTNLGEQEEEKEGEEEEDEGLLFTLDLDSREEDFEEEKSDQTALRAKISQFADGLFEEKRAKSKALFVDTLSKFSGPTNLKSEIILNKQIVSARTAEEVLETISTAVTEVSKGLSPSPLSPFNIATALHRIARNMERVKMVQARRLGFARQREMSLLVGVAMAALPSCSAQGISNISWALSKIGGDVLYKSEMDRVAAIAASKVRDFNAQNVANVALAYATMRHAAPELFARLVCRAAEIVETFNEKEISQLIWACATLNVDADLLLDVVDAVIYNRVGVEFGDGNEKDAEEENGNENEISAESFEGIEDLIEDEDEDEDDTENENENENENEVPFEGYEDMDDLNELDDEMDDMEDIENIEDIDIESLEKFMDDISLTSEESDEITNTLKLKFTRDQLANMAWSYAVLGQTNRPFFSKIWGLLTQLVQKRILDQFREDVLFASQVYMTNQCLKVEKNPSSKLALESDLEERVFRIGQTKRFNVKVSSLFQKEVNRVLVATGLDWVKEYPVDGYTVDAALIDEKVAFEIDGPSHFSRNLGTPLGSTVLKRRYIAAAGWKPVSLSHYEWGKLEGEFEQLEYLRKILGINEDNSDDATDDKQ